MQTIELSKPLLVNGKELTELPCDMDAVTVDQYIKAEALSNAKRANEGASPALQEVDYGFHLYLGFMGVVSADPSIDVADLERITGRDLVKITGIGRFFALGADAGDATESTSEKQSESTPKKATQASTK